MTAANDRRIWLFDTTLRDGAQTQGVDFSVADKVAIARELDRIGIDYVEGGWPGANPTDDAFFSSPPRLERAGLTAFGMTKRPGRSAANDPGLAPLISTPAPVACIVGKTWDFHVDVALEIPREENLELIGDSIATLARLKREALFDAEHFFDGFKANRGYALDCVTTAAAAGARWVVLCDTNGGTLPHDVEAITAEVAKLIPGTRLGIHTHNDTENAVANSLAAVRAGARMVQGTLNGLGERCGNANLIALIPSLMLKMGYQTGIRHEDLRLLTHLSRLLDERLNRAPQRNAAYVGESAFAHKGGLHVSAVEKDPASYEHVDPALVGNRRTIVVSDQAGRSNILARFREVGIEIDPKDPRVGALVETVKRHEFQGYAYDGADASFELLARRTLGQIPDYFNLTSFRVITERRINARGQQITVSEAVVKLMIGGDTHLTAGEGDGPVDALDHALRAALGLQYPELAGFGLTDFKVRILNPTAGTAAVTRVLVESGDRLSGQRWSTVGVSENIIEASYQALHDGIVYGLWRHHARAAAAA